MPSKNLGYILALLAGSCSRFSAEDDSLSEDEIIFSITTFPLSGFLDERDQAKEVTMSASTFYKRHCTYLPAMAGWFICSTALLTYNKVIIGQDFGAFPCPLLVTSVHFFEQWMFSYTASSIFPDFFGGKIVENMSWPTFLGSSIPCGLFAALDIGLSNLALVHITITSYTMVKASFPLWMLIFAFVFRLEKMTCNLILVGFLITAGEILVAFGEVEFDTKGFLLMLVSVICAGIRWALIQLKVQKLDPPLSGPMTTMRLLSCTMFFSAIFMSCIVEQPWCKLGQSKSNYFSDFYNSISMIFMFLLGGVLGMGCVFCQCWLILESNVIVLMIGLVLKNMIIIVFGVLFFGDSLNAINISGIIIVNIGVLLHKVTLPLSKSNNKEHQKVEEDSQYFLCISDDDDSNDDFVPDAEDYQPDRGRGD